MSRSTSSPTSRPQTSHKKPRPRAEPNLPSCIEIERYVLGSIMLDGERYSEIAWLEADDFCLTAHRRIWRAVAELHAASDHVDRVTVGVLLEERGQLKTVGGMAYLNDLENGLPYLYDLPTYARKIRYKSCLRRVIFSIEAIQNGAMLRDANLAAVLQEVQLFADDLRRMTSGNLGINIGPESIRSVDELESVFANPTPVSYLVQPELPYGNLVYLAGESEAGKSTLACAWARDVLAKGHAVLLLDRDRNPRERIRDRFQRLGVMNDHPLLRVWDDQQKMEAPQPDSHLIVEWVASKLKETELPPLVICDSMVSFFGPDEDENSSTAVRAFFNRCRALTRLGACVLVLHHLGKNGEPRGSSDFKPAGDQGFIIRNWNPEGRQLNKVTLSVHKSRYGLEEDLVYNYAGGKMERDRTRYVATRTVTEQLTDLLRDNPGLTKSQFEILAAKSKLPRQRARLFLELGLSEGSICCQPKGRGGQYFLASVFPKDQQSKLPE